MSYQPGSRWGFAPPRAPRCHYCPQPAAEMRHGAPVCARHATVSDASNLALFVILIGGVAFCGGVVGAAALQSNIGHLILGLAGGAGSGFLAVEAWRAYRHA